MATNKPTPISFFSLVVEFILFDFSFIFNSNFCAKVLNVLVFLRVFNIGIKTNATRGITQVVAKKLVKKLEMGVRVAAPQIGVLMPNGIAPRSSNMGRAAKIKVARVGLPLNILIISCFIVSDI